MRTGIAFNVPSRSSIRCTCISTSSVELIVLLSNATSISVAVLYGPMSVLIERPPNVNRRSERRSSATETRTCNGRRPRARPPAYECGCGADAEFFGGRAAGAGDDAEVNVPGFVSELRSQLLRGGLYRQTCASKLRRELQNDRFAALDKRLNATC